MADVSKDKLRKEITAILKNADLTKITAKKVRQTLEEKLDVDLTDQKKLVDSLVMEFLNDKKTASKRGKKTESEDDDDEENGGGEDEDEDDDDDDDDEDEDAGKNKRKAQKRGPQKNNKAASDSDEPTDYDDEDDYGPKKKAKTTAKKGAGKKKKKGSDNDSDEDWGKNKKRGGGGGGGAKRASGGGGKGGYTKTCKLSPELAKLVGKDTMARHEVVKKIWAIIKERNLYDPDNKQYAICDSELYEVMGVKRFRAFSMMKYLKNHFVS